MTNNLFARSCARALALDHDLLSLLMWGMSAGFVHGVGFEPNNRWLRLLLGPVLAWPLLLLGWCCARAMPSLEPNLTLLKG